MSGIRVGLVSLAALALLGAVRIGRAQDLALETVRERRIQSAVSRICQDAWERFEKGQYRRAQTGFRKAGLYRPHDWSLKLDLAHALFGEGDYDYAAYAIRRALDLHPDPVSLDYDLHEVFPTEERYESARDRLVEFVREHPLNRDGQFSWACFALFSGEEEEAQRAFEQVLAIDPKDRYARLFGERLAVRDFHDSRSASSIDSRLGPSGPRVGEEVPPGAVWSDRPGPAEMYRLALAGGEPEPAAVPVGRPDEPENPSAPERRAEPVREYAEPEGVPAQQDGEKEDEELGELEARPPVANEPLPAQGRRAGVLPPKRPALPGRPRLTDR